MSGTLIELRDVTKTYGSVYALGGVSLSMREGEVVGLVGDNGAGKSTLIKILAGVVRPTGGDASTFSTTTIYFVGDPRTIGGTLTINF
jgi:simple sugar transport system ATP-binding protein